MTITPDALRGDLTDLAKQSAGAAATGNELTRIAEDRRNWINGRLTALRATAQTDEADGDEYQALVAERGQLDTAFSE